MQDIQRQRLLWQPNVFTINECKHGALNYHSIVNLEKNPVNEKFDLRNAKAEGMRFWNKTITKSHQNVIAKISLFLAHI